MKNLNAFSKKQERGVRGETLNELKIAVANEKENQRRMSDYNKKKMLLLEVSDPDKVQIKISQYLNQDVELFLSPFKYKKYRIYRPDGKAVDFGDIRYEDFTKHKDEDRRDSYLKRATKIKGKWRDNEYSPNFLSIMGLW